MTGIAAKQRIAIVLFNLGGPDRIESVRPFLFNLFNDAAIINLPSLLRTPLAWLIARKRSRTAVPIYQSMGGGSPILANTQAQAEALREILADIGEVRCFIAMRYWHPMSEETAAHVAAFKPDRIILLPLYPQFSTTTTASSIARWKKSARHAGLRQPVEAICCYPWQEGFIKAAAALIRPKLAEAAQAGQPRLLLSAHGLPEKIIAAGDPYQWQCEQTARAIVRELAMPELDWLNCYQSRVGPLRWIGPSTDDEIRRAGAEKRPLVIFPMAFVSEHSETLVELDIEYRHLAEKSGVPYYGRAATVGTQPEFISGLADSVKLRLATPTPPICSHEIKRLCPLTSAGCPNAV